jgi:glycosyltransferase involved in cell wall biosynthesis
MIVNFFEPVAAKQIGGLELAIRGIESFLVSSGISVRRNPARGELGKTGEREIVHFHGLWESSFLRISAYCRRNGIPYVVSPHGMLEPWALRQKKWKKWPWLVLFERRHLGAASGLLTTSEIEARNLLSLLPAAAPTVAPLGLTAERGADYKGARKSLSWPNTEIVLLFLSRIHPKKGLHVLLRALAGVDTPAKQRTRLVIVGDGDKRYLQELMNFARREERRLPRIDWVGDVWGEAKWKYFQAADLFCLPSFSENFGLAVLEALQVGTRVLTTSQTPWTDVPSWNGGFITDPGEAATGIALEHFFAKPSWSLEQRSQLAKRAQERYCWKKVGPAYLRLYESACAGSGLTRQGAASVPQAISQNRIGEAAVRPEIETMLNG